MAVCLQSISADEDGSELFSWEDELLRFGFCSTSGPSASQTVVLLDPVGQLLTGRRRALTEPILYLVTLVLYFMDGHKCHLTNEIGNLFILRQMMETDFFLILCAYSYKSYLSSGS